MIQPPSALSAAFADFDCNGRLDQFNTYRTVVANYDNDGDVDIYAGVFGSTDIFAISARVSVYSGGRVLVREVNGTSGLVQGSRVQHVGLGSGGLDSVRVLWPSGRVDNLRDLEENGTTRLVERETITAVEEQMVPDLPFVQAPNYPNPFNQTTVIPFSGGAGRIPLIVYNSPGQRVRALLKPPWHRTAPFGSCGRQGYTSLVSHSTPQTGAAPVTRRARFCCSGERPCGRSPVVLLQYCR